MLREALTYLATPCPAFLRRMGYPRELVAIDARYRRWRHAWADHLANSRAVVESAMAAAPRRDCAVVLGAGLLHDVPLAALAAGFSEVVLVDLVHTPWTRWRAGRLPNVRLVSADVTGTLEKLARVIGADLPLPQPTLGIGDRMADLVVSANLLSQLPILPIAWLDRRRREGVALTADAIVEFGRSLISSHLELLERQTGVVALITDVEWLTFAAGRADLAPLEREDALLGLTLPWPGREWIWKMAPAPELDPGQDRHHRVAGILNFTAGQRYMIDRHD